MRHVKRKNSVTHSQEKKKRIKEILPEEAHTLKLLGRDFKQTILENTRA